MIVVTGALGFIGSALVAKLNAEGFQDIVLVDDFSAIHKINNISHKKYTQQVERKDFLAWLDKNQSLVQFIFHLGARTDTMEQSISIFTTLNLEYSKNIWKKCLEYSIPLVYASSAATYGNGENGYQDIETNIPQLKPLNPYGQSKQDFDVWALAQEKKPFHWVGLKFFNVYGPNEYHKNKMASVVYHSYNQIQETNKVKLFRSHNPDYKDGYQLRDFIYVKDVVNVLYYFLQNRKGISGIYNLGTGQARAFVDLVNAVFIAQNKEPNIEFIDLPEVLHTTYQYFTQATMDKLRTAGYTPSFHSLEEGIKDYVQNYLSTSTYY